MNMRLALDMDGVLVDFNKGVFDCFGVTHQTVRGWDGIYEIVKKHYESLKFSELFTKNDFYGKMGREFWRNLSWTPDGKDILCRCEEIFSKENICLVTSPVDTEGCREGKQDWVAREMPDYLSRLVFTRYKQCCAGTHILLDDSPGNVSAFSRVGGLSVLVPRTWNDDDLAEELCYKINKKVFSELAELSKIRWKYVPAI